MADWLKDPATLAEIGAGLGGAGLVGKFWDHLFGWFGRSHERQKDLQAIVDERLKLLLDADDRRLTQMSQAIDQQSAQISEQSVQIGRLESAVQRLVGHIVALEAILRARQIDIPPRPEIELGAAE